MRRRLHSVALAIACLILVGLETPLGSLAFGVECVESCPDDVDEGRCSPVCLTCACPSHARSAMLAPAVDGTMETLRLPDLSEPKSVSPKPWTDEIEHVPKHFSC